MALQKLRQHLDQYKVPILVGGGTFGSILGVMIALKLRGDSEDPLPAGLFEVSMLPDKVSGPFGTEFTITATVRRQPPSMQPAPGIKLYSVIDDEQTLMPAATDANGQLVFKVKNLQQGSHTFTVKTQTQTPAVAPFITLTITEPACPAFHKYNAAEAVCSARAWNEDIADAGIAFEELGIAITWDVLFSGGHWRFECVGKAGTPFPAQLLLRWVNPEGVIEKDDRKILSGVTDVEEETIQTGDARHRGQWHLYVFGSTENIATVSRVSKYGGPTAEVVWTDGQPLQLVAETTFNVTESQH